MLFREIASRMHLENINDVIRKALKSAGTTFNGIDRIAVSNRPGLVGSLIIGTTAAKTLSFALNKPLIPINHVIAHLYSCFLDVKIPKPRFPFIGLVVSGGHTLLMKVSSWSDIVIMGTTIDDAVGEAFDKVAKLLGLSYPGGPSIERSGLNGNAKSVKLPEINMYNKKQGNFNFSYSGLKTAVYYHMRKHPETKLADICASFQHAAVNILVKKTVRLATAERIPSIVVAGGVSANRLLRRKFQSLHGFQVLLPPRELATDNAAMVAGLAYQLTEKNLTSGHSMSMLKTIFP